MAVEPTIAARAVAAATGNTVMDGTADGGVPFSQHFIVIGGGIAGVTAALELSQWSPHTLVTLVSASPVIKGITNVVKLTDNLEDFDVVERPIEGLTSGKPNLRAVIGAVASLDETTKHVIMSTGQQLPYDKVCICTGAAPKLAIKHPAVFGIRDTESVDALSKRLRGAGRVVVLGNGGVALEFVHTVTWCQVHWVIKDEFVGNTFLDASAAAFLVACGHMSTSEASVGPLTVAATDESKSETVSSGSGDRVFSNSIGPQWQTLISKAAPNLAVDATSVGGGQRSAPLHIHHKCQLTHIKSMGEPWTAVADEDTPMTLSSGSVTTSEDGWPVYVRLSNGLEIGCDFVVSATGVMPAVGFLGASFERGPDGGLVVNSSMQCVGHEHVYAAGDAAHIGWSESPEWFQLRLWSQARTAGAYAARCMLGIMDEIMSGMAFELFEHVTRFFGKKVVLLGLFNGQGLGETEQHAIQRLVMTSEGIDGLKPREAATASESSGAEGVQIQVRVTPGEEYIKLVLSHGRVVGAMLIGDTDLEETIENLILNRTNVGKLGLDLLNPDVDMEDYFD